MKIERGVSQRYPQFYGKLRESIVTTHERLIQADLATPDIKKYLYGVRVILSERLVSTAGKAKPTESVIILNVRLLAVRPDQLLRILVHEVAHLLAFKLYGDRGHGQAWKQLMVTLGFEPCRCHSLDTSKYRRARTGDQVSGLDKSLPVGLAQRAATVYAVAGSRVGRRVGSREGEIDVRS
jgi:hypothetical protein